MAREKTRLDAFLIDVANLGNLEQGTEETTQEINFKGARRLQQQYPQFAIDLKRPTALSKLGDAVHAGISEMALTTERSEEEREEDSLAHWFDFARRLRRAWNEVNPRKRRWLAHELSRSHHLALNPETEEPPVDSPFEQAIDRFLDLEGYTKHCVNPDCSHPHFIAKKRSFINCSPECSNVAQKKFKLDWWNENRAKGSKRRAAKGAKKR
jgi:hypothetical protein